MTCLACLAYVDPATSHPMAMLIQTLSAKLGIATGLSLPEACRGRLPRRFVLAL